ncbi:hypothetical protein BH11PSE13_BH11PSE13_39370 [soil metagenome]
MTTPSSATSIESMGKEKARLLDGSAAAMTIAGADMTAGAFIGVIWINLTFTACIFAGDGNIKLASMTACKFIDCTFLAPNHDFGVMTGVTFMRCKSLGRSVFCGGDKSAGVLFDGCDFSGGGAAPEAFEGIGSTGDTTFLNCTGNDQRVSASEPVTLAVGDTLELGLLRFEVEMASGALPATASIVGSDRPAPPLAAGSVADAVEFDLRDLAVQPAWSGHDGFSRAAALDDPFGVLGIEGVGARPAADSLAGLLGEKPAQVAKLNPQSRILAATQSAVARTESTTTAPTYSTARGRSRPDTAALLLDGLHEEFVRVVRDPDQLAGSADWAGVLAPDGESAPTLDELSHRAAPYALLRDILLDREGIDRIIENFDPLTPSTLLEAMEVDDVLHLFAPELARGGGPSLPSLTRREHHEVSPDSHMQTGRLPTDIS